MKTIETQITVNEDGSLNLSIDAGVGLQPGPYRAVLVIEEAALDSVERPPLEFPVDEDLGPWPAALSLRREDIYGDEGR